MTSLLQFNNLSLAFSGKKIIAGLSGRFISGKLNLVVGRAGSGKSSLLLAIAGFHKECQGEILDDQGRFTAAGNISLAFQNPESLFFNPTVGDEIEFALRMRALPENEITDRSRDWLAKWGLPPEVYYSKHPLELSGGEKRRVALAACSVFLPRVIMLDEPLAGLDFKGQRSLADMLAVIASDHVVIVVTHEPEIFLTDDTNILLLSEANGTWFSGSEFLRRSLEHEDFYPLPAWYRQAVGPFIKHAALPAVNASSVADFLQKVR